MPQSKKPRPSTPKKAAAGAKPAKSKGNASAGPASQRAPDAIALLEADHREVAGLFDAFENARGDGRKRELAQAICAALKVHARLEEELFYPAAAAAIEDTDLLDEAQVEHASAKDLIAQIEAGAPGEPLFDAKVMVLGEYVHHHVAEEEGEIFPDCRAAGLDLVALGERMALRKQELTIGFAVPNPVPA